MQNMIRGFKSVIDYLFPPVQYSGNQITDIAWVRSFTKIAQYTAIVGCLVLCFWGFIIYPKNAFTLTRQGAIAIFFSFWVLILLAISNAIKKKYRVPAIPLIAANIFVFFGFTAVTLSMIFQAGRQEFIRKHGHISSTVKAKIAEREEMLKPLMLKGEEAFNKRYETLRKAIRESMDGNPNWMKSPHIAFERITDKFMKKQIEDSKKRAVEAHNRLFPRDVQDNRYESPLAKYRRPQKLQEETQPPPQN